MKLPEAVMRFGRCALLGTAILGLPGFLWGQVDAFDVKQESVRILWVGDILLSRRVEAKLGPDASPWAAWRSIFRQADWLGGNLEGAVGSAGGCGPEPCFAIAPGRLNLLAEAGFNGLSVENNHVLDLGETGRNATLEALRRLHIEPMSFENSPRFYQVKGLTVAVVAINRVGATPQRLPSVALAQKLRLARNLSHVVMVSVHWGSELLEWPNKAQRADAAWLVAQGADVILGHHPHVVQPPELVAGKPVFFSLGNHLFDQRYPATREGLVAQCRIEQGRLWVSGLRTHVAKGSYDPLPGMPEEYGFPPIALHEPISCSGIQLRPENGKAPGEIRLVGILDGVALWKTRFLQVASLETARLDGKADFLVALEWHASPIDHETALRPYVYRVTPAGLEAVWRGSALAWPLLDARVLPGDGGILCALHRGDSFLVPGVGAERTRIMAYHWNGFGFTGVEDQCRECAEAEGMGANSLRKF